MAGEVVRTPVEKLKERPTQLKPTRANIVRVICDARTVLGGGKVYVFVRDVLQTARNPFLKALYRECLALDRLAISVDASGLTRDIKRKSYQYVGRPARDRDT